MGTFIQTLTSECANTPVAGSYISVSAWASALPVRMLRAMPDALRAETGNRYRFPRFFIFQRIHNLHFVRGIDIMKCQCFMPCQKRLFN